MRFAKVGSVSSIKLTLRRPPEEIAACSNGMPANAHLRNQTVWLQLNAKFTILCRSTFGRRPSLDSTRPTLNSISAVLSGGFSTAHGSGILSDQPQPKTSIPRSYILSMLMPTVILFMGWLPTSAWKTSPRFYASVYKLSILCACLQYVCVNIQYMVQ